MLKNYVNRFFAMQITCESVMSNKTFSDKRAAILFGLVVDQLPTKEKISERGKDMLDKALELEPTEFALLHPFVPVSPSPWQTCRGSRKKAASMLYSEVPKATIDDALVDF
ncbi:hypothetical protein B9Z55_026886 [Caenorhabditis nigoni]|nr:hypothetical protein B9Z55_026886 [Caenorhabditis nigoni]